MTFANNINITNILNSSSPKIKAQILIDNEIDIMLNNDMTIKKSEFALLEEGLGDSFDYKKNNHVTKELMKIAIMLEKSLHNTDILFNSFESLFYLDDSHKSLKEYNNKFQEKIKSNFKNIEFSLDCLNKIQQNYDFNINAINKRIKNARNELDIFQERFNNLKQLFIKIEV